VKIPLDAQTKAGKTAAFLAADGGHANVLRMLLEVIKDNLPRSSAVCSTIACLLASCLYQPTAIITIYLLPKLCIITTTVRTGMLRCMPYAHVMLHMMMQAGASPLICGKDGSNPAQAARKGRHDKCLDVLYVSKPLALIRILVVSMTYMHEKIGQLMLMIYIDR